MADMHTFVIWLLMVVTLTGLWGMLYPLIAPTVRRSSTRLRLFANLSKAQRKLRGQTKIIQWLDNMLYLASKRYVKGVSVHRFLGWSVVSGVATMLTVYFFTSRLTFRLTTSNPFGNVDDGATNLQVGLLFAAFIGLLAGLSPLAVLWIRYQRRKIQAGYDLLDVLKVMSRYTHLSADTMLSKTADDLPEDSSLRRAIKLLSFSFASFSSEEELQQEVDRFIGAIGTTFAMSFATQLVRLYRTGGDIALFVNTLIDSMENQLVQVNKVKEEFSDAIALGGWINLFALVAICGGIASFIGWDNYSKLQFQTVQGVTFLGFILVTLVASMVTALVLSRPKLDYR